MTRCARTGAGGGGLRGGWLGTALGWNLVAGWLACLAGAALAADEAGTVPSDPPPFRVGISSASVPGINRNDATAALKVWATTVMRERRLRCPVTVEMFERWTEVRSALEAGQLDAGSLTVMEFLESGLKPESILVIGRNGRATEEYVLLVRRNSGIRAISELRGKRLVWHSSGWTAPAKPWLEVELSKATPERPTRFLGSLEPMESPSKAVLRVFFGQADAGLVTTNAYALAAELNPQVRRDLEVLAVSPPVVPSFFFMRPGGHHPMTEEIEKAILELHTSVIGQQVLTVFMGSRMVRETLDCLDPARALMAAHAKVVRAWAEGEGSAPGGTP